MLLHSLVQFLDALLLSGTEDAVAIDSARNGLQVESGGDIKKVAFAVDSGASIIEKAIELEAQLLVVHHGLFWGQESAISGVFGRKIERLMKRGCSLYASHLPLDAHQEVGNNVELARFLNLERVKPAFSIKGCHIGATAHTHKARKLQEFVSKLATLRAAPPLVLPFGKSEISTVGIITGSGAALLEQCPSLGIDLFISGEPKQSAYHLAKELQINAIFAGHYATETFGVRALQKKISKDFDIATIFIDEDTGI